jgi:hypothetical protein
MKNATIAVITGDLVNSSHLSNDSMRAIIGKLNAEFEAYSQQVKEKRTVFTMFRGDSFQGIVEDPGEALAMAIQLKALVNSFNHPETDAGNQAPLADVRISIGIGEASYDLDAINVSNGEAFQLSGRTLDGMKSQQIKMALTTPNTEVNNEFAVHMKFLDATTDRWSMASAEVVYFLLKNYKEQQIAKELNRSQAAINHRKKAAGWDEIRLLLGRYDQLIKKYFI